MDRHCGLPPVQLIVESILTMTQNRACSVRDASAHKEVAQNQVGWCGVYLNSTRVQSSAYVCLLEERPKLRIQ